MLAAKGAVLFLLCAALSNFQATTAAGRARVPAAFGHVQVDAADVAAAAASRPR